MTATQIKKQLNQWNKQKGLRVHKITVTVAEFEGEFEVYINVYLLDKYSNDEFECIEFQAENESKAIQKAKRIASTLSNSYKASYEGLEL